MGADDAEDDFAASSFFFSSLGLSAVDGVSSEASAEDPLSLSNLTSILRPRLSSTRTLRGFAVRRVRSYETP